jgi:hypothetical protein
VLDDFEARMEARDLIAKGFKNLTPREEDIVVARALYGEKLRAIGDQYGLSVERTRQISVKALRKARSRLYFAHHVEFEPSIRPHYHYEQTRVYAPRPKPIPNEPPAWPFPTPWPKLVIEPPKVIEPPPVWPVFVAQSMTPLKLDRVYILKA